MNEKIGIEKWENRMNNFRDGKGKEKKEELKEKGENG